MTIGTFILKNALRNKRRAGLTIGVTACLLLLALLSQELPGLKSREALMPLPLVLTVAGAIVLLIGSCLVLAVVPSLDPDWSDSFVPPPQPRLRSFSLCRPLNAVFYAQTDWFRLAQKLKPGKYRVEALWGGNIVVDKSFEVGGGKK